MAFADAGRANTSSARALVIGSFLCGLDELKLKPPESCAIENSSKEGNLAESSSTARDRMVFEAESRAAKGSELLADDAAAACGWGAAVGLPRLIGAISRMYCFCLIGDAWLIPAGGGEATGVRSGSFWLRPASDCVRCA